MKVTPLTRAAALGLAHDAAKASGGALAYRVYPTGRGWRWVTLSTATASLGKGRGISVSHRI